MRPILLPLWFVALLAAGCQPAPVVPRGSPERQELDAKIDRLTAANVAVVGRKVDALLAEQARQARVRHWLIVAGIAFLVGGLVSGLGKLGVAASSWYGMLAGLLAKQVRARTVVASLAAGLGCLALAIWIAPVWRYLIDLGWLVVAAAGVFAVWELAARYYTGGWDMPGDGRKPQRAKG